jgi:ComF family protein
MWKILNDLLLLVFPRLCLSCKEALTGNEEHLCLQCLCSLPRTSFCHQKDNPVVEGFAGNLSIVHATAFFHYQKGGVMSHLTYSFKYRENKELAFLLARQAAMEFQPQHTAYGHVDMLIPVPLHPKKERKRGYNQSEWICRGLASVWNIPLRTDILQRNIQTPTQTDKIPYSRWKNVENAFSVKNTEAIQGLHVLLVDDVITSGATLASCAATLLRVADVRVSIFGLSVA